MISLELRQTSPNHPNQFKNVIKNSKKGLYYYLGAYFYNTKEQIQEKYQKLMQFLQQEQFKEMQTKIQRISNNLQLSYKTLIDDYSRKLYLHDIKISCYLCQYINQYDLPSDKFDYVFFPYFLFEVYRDNNSEISHLQFDFIEQKIYDNTGNEKLIKEFKFCQIYGSVQTQTDEFILNIDINNNIMTYYYKTIFFTQASFIVQICRLAQQIYEQTKPVLQFVNPQLNEQIQCMDLEDIEEKKNFASQQLIWNDNIMPTDQIYKYSVKEIFFKILKRNVFIILGYSHFIIAKDKDAKQIIRIIPLKSEFIGYIQNIKNYKDLTLNILDKSYRYIFPDTDSVESFLCFFNKSLQRVFYNINQVQIPMMNEMNILSQNDIYEQRQNIINRYKIKALLIEQKISKYQAKLDELKPQDNEFQCIEQSCQVIQMKDDQQSDFL